MEARVPFAFLVDSRNECAAPNAVGDRMEFAAELSAVNVSNDMAAVGDKVEG